MQYLFLAFLPDFSNFKSSLSEEFRSNLKREILMLVMLFNVHRAIRTVYMSPAVKIHFSLSKNYLSQYTQSKKHKRKGHIEEILPRSKTRVVASKARIRYNIKRDGADDNNKRWKKRNNRNGKHHFQVKHRTRISVKEE